MTFAKALLSLIVGLLFWVATVFILTYPSWLRAVIELIQGGLVFLVFFVGLGFILYGVSQAKE